MLSLIGAIFIAITINQLELISVKLWVILGLMLASLLLGIFAIPLGILIFIIALFQKNDTHKERMKDSGSILIWTSVVIFILSTITTIIFNPFCFEKNKNIYGNDFEECIKNPLLAK